MRRIIRCWICAAAAGLLITGLLLTRMPVCAASLIIPEEYCYQDAFYYQITDADEIIITRSRSTLTFLNVPEQINGHTVTQIAERAFFERTRLMEAILPTTIREIGDYAFCGCSRLMRVQIPEQVERIGIAALEGTPYLSAWPGDYVTEGQQILISYQGTETDVTVPEHVRSIAAGAFENCIGLRRVTIPSSVSGIGMLAFAGCNDLESCFISDGVQDIGAYAFSSCINLREIRIPGTIRSIGNHAFAFCRSLEEIQLPGMLRKLEGAVFMHCTNLKAIEIPYSATEICSYAFYECDALEEVILPPAVSVIGIWAFSRCTNLKHCAIYNTKCQIDEETEVFPEQTIISAVINSAGNEWAWRHQYAFEPLDFIYGDMNGNGMQDIGDAGRILEIYGMMAVRSPLKGRKEDYFAADCNQDGNIDIWDASMVLNAYATAAAAL